MRGSYPWKRQLLLLTPLLAVILICGLTRGWIGYADIGPFVLLRDGHPALTLFMRACSNFIYPLFIAYWLVLLFLDLYRKDRGQTRFMLVYIAIMVVVGVGLPQLLKHVLALPRPGIIGMSPGFPPPDAFKSFPSGHTSAMVGLALPLALRYPLRVIQICAALGMVLVGYSRIWLLRHHPLDILGGAVVGGLVSWLSWRGQAALPKFAKKQFSSEGDL